MMHGLTSPGNPTRRHLFKLWRTMSLWFLRPHASSDMYRTRTRRQGISAWGAAVFGALIVGGPLLNAVGFGGVGLVADAATLSKPSRSTTIALTSNNQLLLVVNRETNSLTVFRVGNFLGQEIFPLKLAEISVGTEPRCVAIHPNNLEAYVTNGVDGTVSVIRLIPPGFPRVIDTIQVGTEPRGCAIMPNGTWLFIANHTEGSLGIIDVATREYLGAVPLGGNPMAIAITNDGDGEDFDETIFVTQFFAEPRTGVPPERIEGFDDGKQGVVNAISVAGFTRIPLSPLANVGFTANRTAFCPNLNAGIHPPHALNPPTFPNAIFCPDPTATAPNAAITQDPGGCFPNQLFSAVLRGNRLWLPNICAGPEPPVLNVNFDTNVQAAVHVVNTSTRQEEADEHVNLNAQITTELVPADPTTSLARIFGNDLVAIDANADGTDFLIVSRGGNYVIRASLDAAGKLTIGAPNNVVRFQTGNLPSGVVMNETRAFVNNEGNVSVTWINLQNNTVLARDIPSGEPPPPGTFEHLVLVGKLAFFTALGIPDNGFQGTDIRDIVPLADRGKQSNSGWSSCGSCHPDGLSDNVTWIFAAGPRQTLPLDAFFAKDNISDQKLVLWTANRGSNTDFNANSRGVQGGCGFASDDFATTCLAQGPLTPANPNIYDHGVTQGGSDALDVQTLWIFAAVRPLQQPQPSNPAALNPGRAVFQTNCASCHGGPKWTKSQIFHRDNPALDRAGAGALALDPGVTLSGPLFASFTAVDDPTATPPTTTTIDYLEPVNTFNVDDPIEIRQNGITAFGAAGFVPPPLLSIRYHAPYLHRGQAQTLADVFPLHALGAGTIQSTLTDQQRADLLIFLNSIDGTTVPLRSAGDDFRDAVGIP